MDQAANDPPRLLAADPLLTTISLSFAVGAIGIVLSGMLAAATRGLRDVQRNGGITMVQSLSSAQFPPMPLAARNQGKAEVICSAERAMLCTP